jgi:hypothetical protein
MTAPITLQLEHKQPEAGNVWSFRFRPSEPLDWLAGQFIRVELPHTHPDAEGTKRYFTIASAPHEGHVQISTRITDSSFKQTLAQLPIGRELLMLDPPAGDFVWPTNPVPPIAQPIYHSAPSSRPGPLNTPNFGSSSPKTVSTPPLSAASTPRLPPAAFTFPAPATSLPSSDRHLISNLRSLNKTSFPITLLPFINIRPWQSSKKLHPNSRKN